MNGVLKVKVNVKVCVYSPDIPSMYSGLYINYPQVLKRTLPQSHLPGENAGNFLQLKPFILFHQVPVTAG